MQLSLCRHYREAQYISPMLLFWRSFQIIVCSLPPPPTTNIFIQFLLVFEVSHACKYHGYAKLIACFYGIFIPNASSRLYYRSYAVLSCQPYTVIKREICIRSKCTALCFSPARSSAACAAQMRETWPGPRPREDLSLATEIPLDLICFTSFHAKMQSSISFSVGWRFVTTFKSPSNSFVSIC